MMMSHADATTSIMLGNNTTKMDADDDHALVQLLPKVELHAHLNGCIREETLFELAKERGVTLNEHHFYSSSHQLPSSTSDDHSMYNVRPRSLQDCFDMFSEMPKCVTDLNALRRITREAIQDFCQQHVCYLELRSTPKQLLVRHGEEEIADKFMYCKTLLTTLKEFEEQDEDRYQLELKNGGRSPRLPMVCRFLVAIDRSQSDKMAMEHVQLALELRKVYGDRVSGVDLGGNPTKVSLVLIKYEVFRLDARDLTFLLRRQNNFADFRDAFQAARDAGLKVTIHCGR
jgi:adenosine deaminase